MNATVARWTFIASLLALWEYSSGRLVSAFFVSKPSAIAVKFWAMLSDGSLLDGMAITAFEAGTGFLIGSVAGALVGVLLARSTYIDRMFAPLIAAFYALPKVALAPLFIMWFGIGMQMKVLFTAAIVFFLVFLNTYTGVRNVSRELITIFRLMGAQEGNILRMVVVPSALTWIFAGLRLSVPYALIGAIVGEIMASNRGLGYLVQSRASQFDTAGVFAALMGVLVLAALLNVAVRVLERVVTPWQDALEHREVAV
jgi:NitT/TauT family transport system permease protein